MQISAICKRIILIKKFSRCWVKLEYRQKREIVWIRVVKILIDRTIVKCCKLPSIVRLCKREFYGFAVLEISFEIRILMKFNLIGFWIEFEASILLFWAVLGLMFAWKKRRGEFVSKFG